MGMLIMLTGNSVAVLLFPNSGNKQNSSTHFRERVRTQTCQCVHVFTFVQSDLGARVSETGAALVKRANCRQFLARISV